MNSTRIIPAIALALALGLSACGSGSSGGEAATPSKTKNPTSAVSGPAVATTTGTSPGSSLDACAAIDADGITRLTGLPVDAGVAGAALGEDSRCEFTSPAGGTDVAVQLGRTGAEPGADSPLLNRTGFEQTFGEATPVDGLAHDAFGALDDSTSVHQAAVVSTDGQQYALVTLTGFDLTRADIDVAARLLAEIEAQA